MRTPPPNPQPRGGEGRRAIVSRDRSFRDFPWQVTGVGVITLVAGLLLTNLVVAAAKPVGLVFIAVVIAEALSPVVSFLEGRIPRVAAVIVVYVTLFLLLIGIGWLVVPPLAGQAAETIGGNPDVLGEIRHALDAWNVPQSDRIVSLAQSHLSRLGGTMVDLPVTIVSAAAEIVFVFFLSLYWLLTVRGFRTFVLSMIPQEHRAYAAETFHDMGRTMGGYVRGAALQGVVIGLLSYIGLRIIGVDLPLVLAVLAGFSELIPVVGPLIAIVPILGIALLDSPTTALITLGFWIVIQQFENHILTPNIMRSQTDLPPFLVLIAVFIGGETAGFVAALVAIPLVGVLKVLVERLVAPWIRALAGVRTGDERPYDSEAN